MKKLTRMFVKKDELQVSIEKAKKEDVLKVKEYLKKSEYVNPCKLRNGEMINSGRIVFYTQRYTQKIGYSPV